MSARHVAQRVAASLAATAAVATLALAFTSPAGAATGPTSGSVIPNAAQPQGTVTPGPFDSGQSINVVVPANQAFNPDQNINIVECSAPDGVVPTNPNNCDGNTLQNGAIPNADGSLTFTGYTVYALPDNIQLGEGTTGPKCGNTLATECMLYIGTNQNDFTQPHLWSQPFLVNTDPTDSGTINPGDGTPEVPMAILLPLAAVGLLGGTIAIRRRHRATQA